MKNVVFSTIVMVLVMVSCNQKKEDTGATNSEKTESVSQLYSCSMHPEITGKMGDKCSKCGMELTEPVN
ncbi:heavy metal-binding domain-containing protein [Flavobacterium sp. W20_MBD1_R3]|uniref:heavy metal-binding domain-containing protein n=1 Tax=Flavobacterium sp. W20_MBD1_R3 TaxID=3240278 RepID=UPI003F9299EC